MGSSDFLPWAIGAGANVEDQGTYAAEIAVAQGFTGGLARSNLHNKLFRQSSFVAASVATFIAERLNINVNDDGDLQNFVDNFTAAMLNLITGNQGHFYTFAGIPTGNVAGQSGTATSPPDLCENLLTGDIYVCLTSGNAQGAVWQVVSNQPDAPGVAQSGPVVSGNVTTWSGNAVIMDSGIPATSLMLATGNLVNGDFPIWNGSSFVDSGMGVPNTILWGGVSTGSGNAQAVTTTPDIVSIVAPTALLFIAGYTNTGAMTINPSNIAPYQVRKPTASGPAPLGGGEVIGGNFTLMAYNPQDNTFQLLNAEPQPSSVIGGQQFLPPVPGGVIPGAPSSGPVSGALPPPASGGPTAIGGGATPGDGSDNKGGTTATNDPGAPDTVIRMDIKGTKLTTSTGLSYSLANASFSCNTLINGVNGLDQGQLATSTGYYFYIIADGQGNVGSLASLSYPTPHLPPGYVYYAPVLWCATDAQRRFYRFWNVNGDFVYNPGPFSPLIDYPIAITGPFNGNLNLAASGQPLAPPEATQATLQVHHTPASGDAITIAPVAQPAAPIYQNSYLSAPSIPPAQGEYRQQVIAALGLPIASPTGTTATHVVTIASTAAAPAAANAGKPGNPAIRVVGFTFGGHDPRGR